MRALVAMSVLSLLTACGGSTDSDGPAADAGTGASGGSGGASGGNGGAPSGGGGAPSGGGGTPSGGASGGSGDCVGLSYCDCKAAASCQVFSEACFCPCGIEPCEPDCDCACGGGKYLGCGPKDVMQPGALEGIWLVGWSGGMNHYSWVRFNADGSADVLDGADLPVNGPLFACSGKGSWIFSAMVHNVHLTLPAACATGPAFDLTYQSFKPASGYAKGAVLEANVTTPPSGNPLEAYKFPASQCDAGMTSCKSPF